MILSSLTARIPGQTRVGEADPAIEQIAYRSDRVAPGSLFCCVRGLNADGHDFAPDVVARGAAALMVERPLGLGVPEVVVPDGRLGMALAAAAFYGGPSEHLPVVGVTGTNGKTTCAFILHSILGAGGDSCGLVGTIEARVGGQVEPAGHTTPESVDLQRMLSRMRDTRDIACVMEVSSHALAQRRVAGTRFAAALFTNLSRDHLDYHDDVESYFRAKRALFVRPPGEGDDPPAALNLDDEFGRRLHDEIGGLGYSTGGTGDVHVISADLRPTGITARFSTPRGPLEITSGLRADFNLANLAGCVAVAELLEIDHAQVAAGISALPGVPGRLEPIEEGQPFQVLVDYAHTPDSLENVLRAARGLASGGRLGVVFGCGGDRDTGKRGPMGHAVRTLADFGVVTSDNPRSENPDAIIAQIVEGSGEGPAVFHVEEDRRAAIARVIDWAQPGDVVVIAGKGHETGQDRNGVVSPFDDREVARQVLAGESA